MFPCYCIAAEERNWDVYYAVYSCTRKRIPWHVQHQLWCLFEDWWWTPQQVMMLHWYQWVLWASEDSMACAAPTVVLVLRLLMNSTAGYDVTLISMSVMGFRGFDGMCNTNCGACLKTGDELHSRLWCYIDINECYRLQFVWCLWVVLKSKSRVLCSVKMRNKAKWRRARAE